MIFHDWMLDDGSWHINVPKVYRNWNIILYYISSTSQKNITNEQIELFDYLFAAMMQGESGWY